MKAIFGGIGDALLCIDSALKEDSINVYTHQPAIQDLLYRFNINIDKLIVYHTIEQINKLQSTDTLLDQSQYLQIPLYEDDKNLFDITFNYQWNLYPPKKSIIGLHPFGSKFSNDFWIKHNQLPKYINEECITYICNALFHKYEIVLFGTQEEINNLDSVIDTIDNLTIANSNLYQTFSLVNKCKFIIGTDSAIKTMASVLKIPSYVYCADYYDHYRDTGPFLQPYINDGIMEVVRFDKMTPELFDPLIEKLLKQ